VKDKEINSTESKTEQPRRKLLKAITVGGATAAVVPAEWAKPALKSVMLPAHAQASGAGSGSGGAGANASNDRCVVSIVAEASQGNSVSRSFSMSIHGGRLASTCPEGAGAMLLFNSSGVQINDGFECIVNAGGDPISFSCSQSMNASFATASLIPEPGDIITAVTEFDNGCACVVTTTVRNQ